MADAPVERLTLTEGPWALTFAGSPRGTSALSRRLEEAGLIVAIANGFRMTSLDGLFTEIAEAFRFPSYFGRNWPALDECLNDLSWLPGPAYVLVVTDADLLFRDDEFDSLPTLLKLVEIAGESWAAPADLDKPWGHGSVPFHAVFHVRRRRLPRWLRRVAASGRQAPAVELE